MVIQVGERISGKKQAELKEILKDLEQLQSKLSTGLHPFVDEIAVLLPAELGTIRNRLFRLLEL